MAFISAHIIGIIRMPLFIESAIRKCVTAIIRNDGGKVLNMRSINKENEIYKAKSRKQRRR
jgi:hypothetical protein